MTTRIILGVIIMTLGIITAIMTVSEFQKIGAYEPSIGAAATAVAVVVVFAGAIPFWEAYQQKKYEREHPSL